MRYGFTLWVILFIPALLFPQDTIVRGRVISAKTGASIQGANIVITALSIGNASALDGTFTLRIPTELYNDTLIVAVTHIAYKRYKTDLATLSSQPLIELDQTVIRTPELEVVGRRHTRAANDLPASVITISVRESPAQTVLDLGDLLARESSLKIEEDVSGGKHVSIRGSNPDEVLVLYDGIPLNAGNNNIVNLSAINLLNVDRIEIIKGSNTTIYGTGIFGGVINIVPRSDTDKLISLNVKTGTYDSEDVSVHTGRHFGNIRANYSFRKSTVLKTIQGFDIPYDHLFNAGTLSYRDGLRELKSSVHLFNTEFFDIINLSDRKENSVTASAIFTGPFLLFNDIGIFGLYRKGSEEESFKDAFFDRGLELLYHEEIKDESWTFRIEDRETSGKLELFYGYDFKSIDFKGLLDVDNINLGVKYTDNGILSRKEHGIFAVSKMRESFRSKYLQYFDWDVSVRYYKSETERVIESFGYTGPTGSDSFDGIIYKIGTKFGGLYDRSRYYIFLSKGNNIKFPTLTQLFNSDTNHIRDFYESTLLPEKNFSTEIGAHLEYSREDAAEYFSEFGVHAAWFENSYLDKILQFQPTSGPPAPINIKSANTSGLDLQADITVIKNLFSFSAGALFLSINNPAAFPFKPDKKISFTGTFTQSGIRISSTWFFEGEQIAQFYHPGRPLGEFSVEARSDIDIHIQRKFKMKSMDLEMSLSGLNLKNSAEDIFVPGLIFMGSKQWYFSMGVAI